MVRFHGRGHFTRLLRLFALGSSGRRTKRTHCKWLAKCCPRVTFCSPVSNHQKYGKSCKQENFLETKHFGQSVTTSIHAQLGLRTWFDRVPWNLSSTVVQRKPLVLMTGAGAVMLSGGMTCPSGVICAAII